MIPDDRHVRAARSIDVYDGDSVTLVLDAWKDISVTLKSRLLGVDTPELSGPTALEKRAARASKLFVDRWLFQAALDEPFNSEWPLVVRSVKITRKRAETGDIGKYGRLLVRVWRHDGAELARDLLDAGLARPYLGGARLAWTDQQLERMIAA